MRLDKCRIYYRFGFGAAIALLTSKLVLGRFAWLVTYYSKAKGNVRLASGIYGSEGR